MNKSSLHQSDYSVLSNHDDVRTAIVRPNGVTSSYAYDAASQVTSITHTGPSGTLMSLAYTYDAAGNRTSVTKDGGNPESYTLDALNRLTNVTYAEGSTLAYTYDANGNRLSLTVNGGTPVIYTYNDADQLTSDGTSTYTYDANGKLDARSAGTFDWDRAGRGWGCHRQPRAVCCGGRGAARRGARGLGPEALGGLSPPGAGLCRCLGAGRHHRDGARGGPSL